MKDWGRSVVAIKRLLHCSPIRYNIPYRPVTPYRGFRSRHPHVVSHDSSYLLLSLCNNKYTFKTPSHVSLSRSPVQSTLILIEHSTIAAATNDIGNWPILVSPDHSYQISFCTHRFWTTVTPLTRYQNTKQSVQLSFVLRPANQDRLYQRYFTCLVDQPENMAPKLSYDPFWTLDMEMPT